MKHLYARITLTAEELAQPPKKSFAQVVCDESLVAQAAAYASIILAYKGILCTEDMPAWRAEIEALLRAIDRDDLIVEIG